MRIEGITQYSQIAKLGKKTKGDAKFKDVLGSVLDTVDISSTKTNKKQLTPHLESIKSKIKSGYYNNSKVADDISEKLANIFDKD